MGAPEQEQVKLPALSPAEKTLNLFFNYYQPAAEMQDADCFFSTAELYRMLREAGSLEGYDHDKLNDWMIEKGYKRRHLGEMQFVWLLKEQR